MNAVVVPVRSMAEAKNRLAPAIDVERRRRLAVAMLTDMLAALACVPALDRTVVMSADRGLLREAQALGADTLDEQHPRGLNPAVAMAACTLERQGVERLLAIPGDVPLIEPVEVSTLFATDPVCSPVVLVPSASGTGTNGLLISPPTILAPRFEGHSLAAHKDACRQAGIEPLVIALPSFALDIDTADDLQLLIEQGAGRHSAAVVRAGLDHLRTQRKLADPSTAVAGTGPR